jgi:indole-3-glycerol phosphate synthase
MKNENFLERIRALTEARIINSRRDLSFTSLKAQASDARRPIDLLGRLNADRGAKIIAEIKRRSPSRGEIASDLGVTYVASAYDRAGATAISVLTEPNYFGGSLSDLREVRRFLPQMPLLLKDFVIDPYQLMEARVFGADAVLLIHKLLGADLLAELHNEALALGLTPLVEVHCETELEHALNTGCRLIGVNNRDLSTLEVDLSTAPRLVARCKGQPVTLIAESGIETADQVRELSQLGYRGFLIGTKLMSGKNPESDLRRIVEGVA